MRINQNPGRTAKDRLAVSVHNADTVAIPAGTPVVLVMNGTNDGLDVVLPTSATNNNYVQGLYYGVVFRTLQVGDFGEAVVFGITNTLLLIRQTRAASTAVWATEAARSVGEWLTMLSIASGASNGVGNGFQTMATGVVVLTATAGSTTLRPYPDAVLCQTLASYASSASTTSDTRTAITAAVKAFVRMM